MLVEYRICIRKKNRKWKAEKWKTLFGKISWKKMLT